jgi:hypothetical protein
MSAPLQEYDVVRVVKLNGPTRDFQGTRGVKRAPRIGDEAMICDQPNPGDPTATLTLEMVDKAGMTVWLADFQPDELVLVSRPAQK